MDKNEQIHLILKYFSGIWINTEHLQNIKNTLIEKDEIILQKILQSLHDYYQKQNELHTDLIRRLTKLNLQFDEKVDFIKENAEIEKQFNF